LNACTALKIAGADMIGAMRQDRDLRERFFLSLLARTMRAQADLVDHLFNSCEKRLARILLLVAESGKPDKAQTLIPPVTQEALAEMIGTTRSRVSYFMNRFRNLGLIEYKDRIQVDKPRLQAMLLDGFAEA
jgi:CRP-like cAMP-binding protein